jgi:hypothetical protein
MFWAAERAAYDPETLSMLTTVLERAVAALLRISVIVSGDFTRW